MSDPVASEKAAELAKKNKIDLASIKGTGSNGLIKIDDVRAAIAAKTEAEDAEAAAAGSGDTPPAADPVDRDDTPAPDPAAEDKPAPARKKSAMRERAHLEGCPINPDRVEIYEARVPPKRNSDGMIAAPARMATMAHCCDCGATTEIE